MPTPTTGGGFLDMLQSIGVDVTGLQTKGIDYLMKQAAAWARVPTRLQRVQAAVNIVGSAAQQKGNASVAQTMATARDLAGNLRQAYDSASADVADVVDVARAVQATGEAPPVEIVPKAIRAAGVVAGVLNGLTQVERQVMGAAAQVLTPAQVKQLAGGVSFTAYMATASKNVGLYLLLGVPLYFVLFRKRRRA